MLKRVNNLSLQARTVIYILIVSFIIFTSITSISLYYTRQAIKKEAYQGVENKANEIAQWITNELNSGLVSARNYGSSIQAMQKSGNYDRTAVMEMAKYILETDSDYYSVWAAFEHNGFDKRDSLYKMGFKHSTSSGCFSPGYNRNKDQIVISDALSDLEKDTSAYYKIPKIEQKDVVLEPYLYSYTGNPKDAIIETSVIASIIENGKFIGATGVDISLNTLQNYVSKISLFKTGYCKLISNNGIIVANPEPSKIFKPAADLNGENGKIIAKVIKEGEKLIIEDYSFQSKKNCFKIFIPIKIGTSLRPWSVGIVAPTDEILADSNSKFQKILIISILGFVMLGFIIFYLIQMIVRPIKKTTTILHELSQGHFNHSFKLESKGNDEVGIMANAVNKLIDGLNSTSVFAREIGEGNLNANFVPLSGNDQLGNSLIAMRESLISAKEEEEQRKIEDAKRNWASEGIAKFSEILRQNNDNLDVLAFSITKNLVSYLKLNQGGLFIVEDSDKNDIHLKLSACYAYDRRKFLEKKIYIGEGLVGACYQEQQTIYLTDIPNDYINITSGLGSNNPKCILIVPLKLNDEIFGIIELASFKIIEKHEVEFVEKIAESIASTISSVKVNIRTTQLLEISQLQSEEMRAQEEEMRQNLEEMHATQEEMGRKNAEIENILEAIDNTIGAVEISPDGRIIKANDLICKTLGISKSEVLYKQFRSIFTIDTETEILYDDTINEALTGKAAKMEVIILSPSMSKIWLEITFNPLCKENGEVEKMLAGIVDISPAKRALLEARDKAEQMQAQEEELRQNMEEMHATQEEMERKSFELEQNEAKVKTILDSAPEGIISVTMDGTINEVNEPASTLTGFKYEELKGLPVSTITKFLKLDRITVGGKKREKVLRKDGTSFMAEITFKELMNKGQHEWLFYMKDMTVEIKKEQELVQIIENTSSANSQMKEKEVALQQSMEELKAIQEAMDIKSKETEQMLELQMLNNAKLSAAQRTIEDNQKVFKMKEKKIQLQLEAKQKEVEEKEAQLKELEEKLKKKK